MARNERIVDIPGLTGGKVIRQHHAVGERLEKSNKIRIYTNLFPEDEKGAKAASDLIETVSKSIGRKVVLITIPKDQLYERQEPPITEEDSRLGTIRNVRFVDKLHGVKNHTFHYGDE